MAIDFDKIDRSVDLKGLQADVEDAMKHGGNTPATPAPETTDTATTAPSRRGRKAKAENPTETPVDAPEPVTENADNAPLSSDANCPSEDVEEPAPKMDVNPPRRTRKKREE